MPDPSDNSKPVVLITGASGDVGSALIAALESDYRVVGMDLEGKEADCDCLAVDLTNPASIELALSRFRDRFGDRIAAVIHLAAYFDFTGEPHPLYEKLNVEGTRHLLEALQDFEVERLIYSGTMLVHEPFTPGHRIDETTPIAPKWAYPKSKAAAEEAIAEAHGKIPYVLLHLAGLYDERTAVPTLSHQIARIYERDPKSFLYAGDPNAGQALIHKDDLADAFRRAVDRRRELPEAVTLLVGEPEPVGYAALQDLIGELVHGKDEWTTLSVPKPLARVGAWLETEAEPIIPDDFDQGEKPFIRPFMVDMASDHYALDIRRARELLGWAPGHDIRDVLPDMVAALKDDPAGWYAANGITPPDWLEAASEKTDDPHALRRRHEAAYRQAHRRSLWAHFANLGLGAWLLTSPPFLAYGSAALVWSDLCSGALLTLLAFVSLSARHGWARWACAGIGVWLLFAPLVFWAPTATAYLNDTLVGALVIGFAVALPPPPGVDLVAARTGPTVPPGWDFNPSSWFQRLPIIILAVIGFQISRYMAAYQLGHIDGVWEPFFSGGPGAKNGTEEIITSRVSEAWPVPDAGMGAMTYMLEILTGAIGSARRWRTMPWLVLLFGFMIVPLGAVSITFIIIQPIVIGTWCTLCLIAAVAMLVQIPYSLDEIVATCAFLRRRWKKGRPLRKIFFVGDTDEGGWKPVEDDFRQPPATILRDMATGGVTLPWNLALSIAVGLWLLFTRATVGAAGGLADMDHLIGSLAITVAVIALAEVARPVRLLNIPIGMALFVPPLVYDATWPVVVSEVVSGLLLIGLSLRRGPIRHRYGDWNRALI